MRDTICRQMQQHVRHAAVLIIIVPVVHLMFQVLSRDAMRYPLDIIQLVAHRAPAPGKSSALAPHIVLGAPNKTVRSKHRDGRAARVLVGPALPNAIKRAVRQLPAIIVIQEH